MATLKITYWSGADAVSHLAYNHNMGNETIAIGASSVRGNAIPDGAAIARIRAVGAACRFSKGSATSDASVDNTQYLADGEVIDVQVKAGNKVAVIADAT